jgi:hypothetical protein
VTLVGRVFLVLACISLTVSGVLSCVVEVIGDLKLENVSGIVFHAYDNAPVSGARVELWETTAGTYKEYAEAGSTLSTKRIAVEVTGKDGRFKFEKIRPRSYEIVFISEKYGTRKAYLEVYSPGTLGKRAKQEAVAVLSRRDGPCGSVSQSEPK